MIYIKKQFVFTFLFLFTNFGANAENVVYFSPKGNCEKIIVERINSTKKTLDVAVYSINNKEIVKAIIKARERGVKIRILTDKIQSKGKTSKVKYLYESGINIRVNSKFRIEHNKFAIYDKNKVSSGSFNWTEPAEKKNSENCIFVNNTDKTIDSYNKRFEYLWKINTKEKSDNWIKKHLIK